MAPGVAGGAAGHRRGGPATGADALTDCGGTRHPVAPALAGVGPADVAFPGRADLGAVPTVTSAKHECRENDARDARTRSDVANPRGLPRRVRLRDGIQPALVGRGVARSACTGRWPTATTRDGSDVDLVVVTYRPGAGPRPGTAPGRRRPGRPGRGHRRRVPAHAPRHCPRRGRCIADRYVTTQPLHDPRGWLDHAARRPPRPARRGAAGASSPTLARRGLVPGGVGARPRHPAGRVVRHRRRAADARRGAAARRAWSRPAQPHLLPQQRRRGAAHRAGRRRHDRARPPCCAPRPTSWPHRGRPVDGTLADLFD